MKVWTVSRTAPLRSRFLQDRIPRVGPDMLARLATLPDRLAFDGAALKLTERPG